MCVFGSYRKLGQTKNHFRKWFYTSLCVWLRMENKIFRKNISFDHVFYGFDPEIGLHFYFHYKPFPGLWERERSPPSLLSHTILSILSHTHFSPIAHLSIGESKPSIGEIAPRTHPPIDPPSEWPTPRSTHHLQIDPPRPPASCTHEPISLCPSLTIGLFFVLIFVSCVVYIFWFSVIIFVCILRKCEKHVKNGISKVFSATQPNTRKYFPKHSLECNQTLENIFLSQKYFYSKIFYTRKIFYIQPNTLSHVNNCNKNFNTFNTSRVIE